MPSTTASTVSAIFNNDGQFFRLDDGRKLGDVAAEHGGATHKTTDRDDTVIVFADGSAIGCTGDGWDIVHLDADAEAPTYRTGCGDWTFILA
tara:strand:- start:333 stop:608 length:276 start_codon:yes stop_codon:yes gene_type:complete